MLYQQAQLMERYWNNNSPSLKPNASLTAGIFISIANQPSLVNRLHKTLKHKWLISVKINQDRIPYDLFLYCK